MTAAWGRLVVACLRALRIKAGKGIRVSATPSGVVVSVDPSTSGLANPARPTQIDHPFRLRNASTTAPAAAKVRVRFGQVNSITPTIDGVPLNAAEPPALTVVTGVIYLRVEVDVEGVVTAATIASAAELPADTATYGHLTIGEVTVADNKITVGYQSVTHSLQHRRCGVREHHWWGV